MTWLTQIASAVGQPFKWWVVVAPWEQALRVRLGKVAAVLGPGVHFRVPFLDRVYRKSIRLRAVSRTGQTVTTKDGKCVTLGWVVEFAVADIRQLYERVAMPEDQIIAHAARVIATKVYKTSASEFNPTTVGDIATRELSGMKWGLASVVVSITEVAFARTYRLLNNDYTQYGSLNSLEHDDGSK